MMEYADLSDEHKKMVDALASKMEDGAILVYNNITREKQPYKLFEEAYGEPWASIYLKSAKRILKEGFSQEARVSKEDGRAFWNKFSNGGQPDPKGLPVLNRESNSVYIPNRLLTDCNVVARIRHCMFLYMLLLRGMVDKPFDNDYLKIYDKFYSKGMVAVAITREELGKLLCMTDRGVTKQTNYLVDNKMIERVVTDRKEDKYSYSIYILGNHDDKGHIVWVYDDDYKSKYE